MLTDYTSFFNIHDLENKDKIIKCNLDFNSYFGIFLNDIGCNPYYIRSLCNIVFSSMTSDKCFYHTPVHVLSMIGWAEKNNIELQNWEKLSILFHDVIYKPGSKNNETNSIQFMLSLLDGSGIEDSLKTQAAYGIQNTAMHLEEELDPDSSKLLDLDMAGFAASLESYEMQNTCIELEFCKNANRYDGISKSDYTNGRKIFLNKLLSKKSIYRTELFKTNFESIARNNISTSLKQLETV